MIMQITDQNRAFDLLFNAGKSVREEKIIR
jgi:hypothetical protein